MILLDSARFSRILRNPYEIQMISESLDACGLNIRGKGMMPPARRSEEESERLAGRECQRRLQVGVRRDLVVGVTGNSIYTASCWYVWVQ